jgi:hypothetical protein
MISIGNLLLKSQYSVRKHRKQMFKTEQNIAKNSRKPIKRLFFQSGTTFAKKASVKQNITYREIILAIGILVALLVAFTLWIHNPGDQSATQFIQTPQIPTGSFSTTTKNFIESAVEAFFNVVP